MQQTYQIHTTEKRNSSGRHSGRRTWSVLSVDEKCSAIIRNYKLCKEPTAAEIADRLSVQLGMSVSRAAVSSVVTRNKERFKGFPFEGNLRPARPKEKSNVTQSIAAEVSDPAPTTAKKMVRVPHFSTHNFFLGRIAPLQEKRPPLDIENGMFKPAIGEPAPLNVSLVDIEKHQCRWPVSTGNGGTLFCGHDSLPSKPYCACHTKRAYDAGSL